MSDTYTLHLENFRSIRDATVEIAPADRDLWAERLWQVVSDLRTAHAQEFFYESCPERSEPVLVSYDQSWGLREVVRNHIEDAPVNLSLGIRSEHWSSGVMLSLDQSGGVVGRV